MENHGKLLSWNYQRKNICHRVKFKFFEDAEYDYEEDTEEYEKACSATDAWSEIMDRLEEKVRETAASEGLFDLIPSNETIEQIEPFMNKCGYINAKGWWVKAGS